MRLALRKMSNIISILIFTTMFLGACHHKESFSSNGGPQSPKLEATPIDVLASDRDPLNSIKIIKNDVAVEVKDEVEPLTLDDSTQPISLEVQAAEHNWEALLGDYQNAELNADISIDESYLPQNSLALKLDDSTIALKLTFAHALLYDETTEYFYASGYLEEEGEEPIEVEVYLILAEDENQVTLSIVMKSTDEDGDSEPKELKYMFNRVLDS